MVWFDRVLSSSANPNPFLLYLCLHCPMQNAHLKSHSAEKKNRQCIPPFVSHDTIKLSNKRPKVRTSLLRGAMEVRHQPLLRMKHLLEKGGEEEAMFLKRCSSEA